VVLDVSNKSTQKQLENNPFIFYQCPQKLHCFSVSYILSPGLSPARLYSIAWP